jgi:hypothetical protein
VAPDDRSDRCPDCPYLIYVREGDPEQDFTCPRCGRPVELVIREVIIDTSEDWERFRQMAAADERERT